MQANSGDPDQTPHFVASDLCLHYLPSESALGTSNLSKFIDMQLL